MALFQQILQLRQWRAGLRALMMCLCRPSLSLGVSVTFHSELLISSLPHVIGCVVWKPMLMWSLGHRIFIKDQHLWEGAGGSRIG